MKQIVLATAIALAMLPLAAQASSEIHGHRCDIRTDWSVREHRRAFVFERKDHSPEEVGIGGGRLFIDGKEQHLSEADHARLRQLESDMTALVPELRRIVLEAVDIAFVALSEVARGLASDPKAVISDLDHAHVKLRAQLDAAPLGAMDGDAVGDTIAPVMAQFVPQIVGGAVSSALGAAFGGEQKAQDFEKKMQRMEHDIDSKVEQRAKRLDPLADDLCRRMQAMDRIDDELAYRLPDGGRLELLRVGRGDKD